MCKSRKELEDKKNEYLLRLKVSKSSILTLAEQVDVLTSELNKTQDLEQARKWKRLIEIYKAHFVLVKYLNKEQIKGELASRIGSPFGFLASIKGEIEKLKSDFQNSNYEEQKTALGDHLIDLYLLYLEAASLVHQHPSPEYRDISRQVEKGIEAI